ncbi:hypothetical protein GF318_05780, partial [Candidatus Micrarchaeota archaeon]|nr:hypothetical protein [Candidatus Micrarchaeota archaeon]
MKLLHAMGIIFLVLFFSAPVFAYTNVSSCQAIGTPGEYRVNETLYGAPVSSSCLYITSSDVLLDCQDNMLDRNGTGTTDYAIQVYATTNLDNITVKNCHIWGNSTSYYRQGIRYYLNVHNSSIINNTIERTNEASVHLQGNSFSFPVNNITIQDNTVRNGSIGIRLLNAFNCRIENNDLLNNTYRNIYLGSKCPNTTITGNDISIDGNGIETDFAYNATITNNYIHDYVASSGDKGIDIAYECNSTIISGNNLTDVGNVGIRAEFCDEIEIAGNIIENSSNYGLRLDRDVQYSCIYNNEISGADTGVSIEEASNNNSIYNNTVFGNSNYGFRLAGAYENNLSNNTAHGQTAGGASSGFYLNGSVEDNRFENNVAYNNSRNFMLSGGATNNVLVNNTARDSTPTGYGFYFSSGGPYNDIRDSQVYNNYYGVYNYRANINMTTTHFYNNSLYDFYSTTSTTIRYFNLTNVIFDNPQGNYQDFTNLSLDDDSKSETYFINWTSASAPAGNQSFAGKWIDISKQAFSTVYIDEVTWHWRDDEVTGNESELELWKNNASGWTLLNGSPDAGQNSLAVSNHSPGSVYGILRPVQTGITINSSGTYTLSGNISGAGQSVAGIPGINSAGVVIEADDVVLDCNGYSIINDGTANAAGLVIPQGGYSNIEFRNCPMISQFENGIYVLNASSVSFSNLTVFNNSVGIVLNQTTGCVLSNSSISNNTGNGVEIYADYNTQASYNDVSNNGANGFSMNGSTGAELNNNNASANGANGFDLPDSTNASVDSNDAWDNDGHGYNFDNSNGAEVNNNNATANGANGFDLPNSNNASVDSNDAWNNTGNGYSFDSSGDAEINNNNASANGVNGFDLPNSNDASVNNNDAASNDGNGYDFGDADGAQVEDNGASDNGGAGFHEDQGTNNSYVGNTAEFNDGDGYSFDGVTDDEFLNNSATGNGGNGASVNIADDFFMDPSWFCNNTVGIFINQSNNTVIQDSVACNNSQYGIYILDSDNITVNGTSRTYNNSMDLRVENNLGSSVTL